MAENRELFIASVMTIVKKTGLRQHTKVYRAKDAYNQWANSLSANKILAEGDNYTVIETEVCIYTSQFKTVDIIGMFIEKDGK